MAFVPPARHLLRARDLADARYADPIDVDDMAHAAGLSRAHFSREFKKTFGESPRSYLLTRRLERAATLLRNTDRSVAEICLDVGLQGIGSFTSSFKRHFDLDPDGISRRPPAGGCPRPSYRPVSSGPTGVRNAARFEKTASGPRPSIAPRSNSKEETMIKIANAQLWVHDQEEALAFYSQRTRSASRSRPT